jgi:hypothetical protein
VKVEGVRRDRGVIESTDDYTFVMEENAKAVP